MLYPKYVNRTLIIFISLLSLFFTCQNPVNKSDTKKIVDTLYASNTKPFSWYKKYVIHVTDTANQTVEFIVGQSTTIEIWTPDFESYPIVLKNLENVKLVKSDSVAGVFTLIPLDTIFRAEAWQDFGENNVVVKSKSDSPSEPFKVQWQNGPMMITTLNLKALNEY